MDSTSSSRSSAEVDARSCSSSRMLPGPETGPQRMNDGLDWAVCALRATYCALAHDYAQSAVDELVDVLCDWLRDPPPPSFWGHDPGTHDADGHAL